MADLKIFAKTVDEKARQQIEGLIALPPFRDCKIRIMPDVHAGAGCVIGFTANLGEKVIPNIVGVDIGCGMYTLELGKRNIDFDALDSVIRTFIPSGMRVHGTDVLSNTTLALEDLRCFGDLRNVDRLRGSLGTLGGGNHFIEVDVDSGENKYLVIHTGSRNLGKQVADIYQARAIAYCGGNTEAAAEEVKATIQHMKANGEARDIPQAIAEIKKRHEKYAQIPKELCFLEGDERDNYLKDMEFCRSFAELNRLVIADIIASKMGWEAMNGFQTVHNYIEEKSLIVRKGAISAERGERLLIPINMRDGSIIGVGKGNQDWNCSAPHGAGRIMSRMQAKKTLTLEDYASTMDGIYTTSVGEDTIDEAPQVYKPMEEIVDCINDTVNIEKIIRPVYNFKAGDDD